jgi:hypothetical protein
MVHQLQKESRNAAEETANGRFYNRRGCVTLERAMQEADGSGWPDSSRGVMGATKIVCDPRAAGPAPDEVSER